MVRPVLAAVAALAFSGPALAHHAMDGATPSSLLEGVLSGIGPPVIALDHLAFIIPAGLLAAPPARAWLLPLAFGVASFAGSRLRLARADPPGGATLIRGPVRSTGRLLVSLRRIGGRPFAALLGLAGLLHGHALAETIIGAEPTPLVAYLGGLAVTEYAIAAAAVFGWRLL